MADMKPTTTWAFQVSNAEMRLILQALGGRLRSEDIGPAKLLGDTLTRQRAESLEQTASQLRRSLGES